MAAETIVTEPAIAPQPVAPPTPATTEQPIVFGAPLSQTTEPVTSFPSQFSQQPAFPAAAPAAEVPPMTPQPVAHKKKLGLFIGAIVGGVILVGGLAAVLFFVVLPSGKIAESDLVSATSDNTAYLHPKQWEAITLNSISGYGDKKAQDSKSTAAIFLKKGTYVKSGLIDASDSDIDSFRSTVLSAMSTSDAEDTLKESGECESVNNVSASKSSVKTMNMIGIMRLDGICVRDTTNYRLSLYIALGNDGYLRSIIIMATESLWKQNEAVFNKMLESADQV